MTLEELYLSLGDCDTATEGLYDKARKAKVCTIAGYIAELMKEPEHSQAVAEAIMASAEEMGRITGNDVAGELSSRYTITGNPNAFSI